MEWLFRSQFDTETTIALWSVAGVVAATIVLFVYTVGLRFATVTGSRRRARLVSRWREVFAIAILDAGETATLSLPPLKHSQQIDLLEEWNRARSSVEGSAALNLIALAERIGLPAIACRLFESRRVRSRILATHTLGHLQSQTHREEVALLIDHRNSALSITAAVALADIDPDYAVSALISRIDKRRDWPKTRVSTFLRTLGSERISEPMFRAIRSADNAGKTYLLQFAQLVEASALNALLEELIRESNDAGVLNAALKLVSGFDAVPRIAFLTHHDAWFVRMQAAKVLGRVGQEEHLPMLETLLDDREWWVRYRAAQSIAALPFLGPNRLRQIRERQSDPFAADILQQAYAEIGLA